jgi:ABC-type antimicrobial peptide transport system permease subunit
LHSFLVHRYEERVMLKFLGGTIGVIFVIGLLVVIGLLMLVF